MTAAVITRSILLLNTFSTKMIDATPCSIIYQAISPMEARHALLESAYLYGNGRVIQSRVNHQRVAEKLSDILNSPVSVNKQMVALKPGDMAIQAQIHSNLQDPLSEIEISFLLLTVREEEPVNIFDILP
jgi:hypothetical protein